MFRYQAGLTSRSARPGGGVIGAGSTVHGPRSSRRSMTAGHRWRGTSGASARSGWHPWSAWLPVERLRRGRL